MSPVRKEKGQKATTEPPTKRAKPKDDNTIDLTQPSAFPSNTVKTKQNDVSIIDPLPLSAFPIKTVVAPQKDVMSESIQLYEFLSNNSETLVTYTEQIRIVHCRAEENKKSAINNLEPMQQRSEGLQKEMYPRP